MADIVIGSGPSGVSVAMALLARGRKVLMLDGGRTLEPEATGRRDGIAAVLPSNWNDADRAAYQAPQFSAPPGQVRRYGSDFAQEPASETHSNDAGWLPQRISRATGGLSNLWGSAVSPYCRSDLRGWPILVDDLAPHYQAVAKFMPVAGQVDDLQTVFPAFSMAGCKSLAPSVQATELLARLTATRDHPTRKGVHCGLASVAVDAGCKQCGMCLHGCPWGHIYSAALTVADLRDHPDFSHRPGSIVTGFSESENGVALTLETGEFLKGGRAFFATGVLETARIFLANSATPDQITLKDSQHAFVPMLHRWKSPGRPDQFPFTTLPQLFVEIEDPSVSPHLVHSQIYTWNENYIRDLMANYGRKLPGSGPLFRLLAGRLIVAQMFLHSDHCATIGLELASDGRLKANLQENPETQAILSAAVKKLAPAMSRAGMTTLGFATRAESPGSSYHSGGTFAMAKTPVTGQSDILGRPFGLKRIHIVDASVLPAIPATTITFSVMANAHRIGSLAP